MEKEVFDTYIDENDMPYSLVGYYVKSKLTGQELYRKMVGDIVDGSELTANKIIKASATVLYGGLDIYMIYKPTKASIVINAVDIDTDKIIKRDMYRGTVSRGEDFEQVIDGIITENGVSYNKTKHFYYLYRDSSNNQKKTRD